MLELMARIPGCRVFALDGRVGTACDLYFDDGLWTVQYLVVATRGWLSGRKVLISPAAIRRVEGRRRTVAIDLTSERVFHSPDVDAHKPVSLQHTISPPYFGFPDGGSTTCWPPAFVMNMGRLTNSDRTGLDMRRTLEEWANGSFDSHLRSGNTVLTYRVRAKNGDYLGHVCDFLFDVRSWHIYYLLVVVRN